MREKPQIIFQELNQVDNGSAVKNECLSMSPLEQGKKGSLGVRFDWRNHALQETRTLRHRQEKSQEGALYYKHELVTKWQTHGVSGSGEENFNWMLTNHKITECQDRQGTTCYALVRTRFAERRTNDRALQLTRAAQCDKDSHQLADLSMDSRFAETGFTNQRHVQALQDTAREPGAALPIANEKPDPEEGDNRPGARPKAKESKLMAEVKKLKGWKACTEKCNSQLLASRANLAGKVRAKQIKKEIIALQSKAQQLIKELQTAFVNCQWSLIGAKALVKRCAAIKTNKVSLLAEARPHEKPKDVARMAMKAIGKTARRMAMKAKAFKKAMKK